MNVDTRTIENFLNDDEVEILEQFIMTSCDPWENWNPGDTPSGQVLSGWYYGFDFYNEKNKLVRDILQPKFDREFGTDLVIQQIHIFDSIDPYKIHSDVDNGDPLPHAPNAAWTFIIPLFDVNSHTIVFNEESEIKILQHYMQDHDPYDPPKIDYNTWKEYFSHCPYEYCTYLSIEDIFKWKKGSLFAASRYKFHTSDNFLKNGVKNKRAIVAWTSLP